MKSKHLFTKLIIAGLLGAGLAGCGDVDPTRVTGVKIPEVREDNLPITMEKEDTFQLSAVIEPSTAVNTLVSYESTDENIIKVDQNGLVTAIKDGKAAIIVRTNDGGKTAKCEFDIKTTSYRITSDISVKKSFLSYTNNKRSGLGDAEQFIIPNLEYNVGTNNAVNLMPDYEVWSDEGLDFVDNSKWKYDHDIKVEIKDVENKYVVADSSYYNIESKRSCDIKFNSNAVGKVFKVTITPGNLSAEFKAAHPNTQSAVYEGIKVVDGYNISKADDLAYIDTIEDKDGDWYAFKEVRGMDIRLHPTSLVIHNNMQITKANLPASFFWSGLEGEFNKYNGTLKDWSEVYRHTTGDNLIIYGNYFKLDFSQLPVVEYKDGKAVDAGFVSHSVLVTVENGSASFNNLNLLGNASKSKEKEDKTQDTSGRGGFIFCKGRWLADGVTANNNLFRSWFITYMGEDASNPKGYVDYVLNNCKGRDNYNSFLYNWGGKMTCTGCSFKGCGGPIVIQDHIDVSGNDFGAIDGSTVNGRSPSTTFVDCELVNYVAGTEAWFVQFGATGVVADIKAMSDLYLTKGATYLVAENPTKAGEFVNTVATEASSAATGGLIPYLTPSFFNFIAINKSGSAEGMTNLPVHGEVSIINTEKMTNQTYNYSRPNMNKSQEITDLINLAIKYGLYTAENAALFAALNAIKDSADGSTASDKATCTMIRTMNSNGAPVFQCGNNLATYAGDPSVGMLDLMSMATTPAQAGADFATYVSPADGVSAARQDTTAIYFNGMMLVFGLTGFTMPQ